MISKMKTIAATAALAGGLMLSAQAASAASITLESLGQCSADPSTATNGIVVGDVTGNLGGATDCWGTVDGNDPEGDGFTYAGVSYGFISKVEELKDDDGFVIGEKTEGTDIGLTVNDGLGSSSGTWAFDGLPSGLGDFLIVLKAANSPGYAVWSFFGDPANTSVYGSWNVAWTAGESSNPAGLSHLSVYAAPNVVPLPAAGWLLLMGLGGLGFASRRKRKAQTV